MNAVFLLAVAVVAQVSEVPVRFFEQTKGNYVVQGGMLEETAAKLPMGKLTQEQGEKILIVSLVSDDKKTLGSSILGKYERTRDNRMVFTPRFPLVAGQTYRATWKAPGQFPTEDFVVPKVAAKTPPTVVKIYPTTDVLPANHLKFYIYFDRPMRGGKELFQHIVLIDDKGNEILDPWLIDEIWDEENHCLILYIHPGRIKWGVELREILGPVLHEKREYSLVIRRAWTDIDGNKMSQDVVKKFRTTPEDRVRIDLSQWKLTAAKTGTREPLTLKCPKPIDHRSLQRFLIVTDDKGLPIDGKIAIGSEEKSWLFTPTQAWQNRGYRLEIGAELEDVAGNTPVRPFDMDLKAPKLAPQRLRIEFQAR